MTEVKHICSIYILPLYIIVVTKVLKVKRLTVILE